MTQEKNIEYYKLHSQSLDEWWEKLPWRKLYLQYEVDYLKNFVNKESQILEVGCGTGIFADSVYHQITKNIVGLDISSDNLKIAKLKGRKFKKVLSDADNMPFSDNSFDLLVYNAVLHHLPDLKNSLKEAYRVVKPGGYIFLTEPNAKSIGTILGAIYKPERIGKFIKFRKKTPKEIDFELLGNKEQRTIWPPVLKDALNSSGFDTKVFMTIRFLDNALRGLNLNLIRRNNSLYSVIKSIDEFLMKVPMVNQYGGYFYVLAQKSKNRQVSAYDTN